MLPPVSNTGSDQDAQELARALAWLGEFTDWEQLKPTHGRPFPFGLERMDALLQALGNPQRARPAIHITGTKGKSSTSNFAAAIITAHGVKTLRYISPHVESVTERIATDGANISGAEFASLADQLRPYVNAVRSARPELVPTFFEAITAIAFLHALRAEASVLEVGLGGRLDATNVVVPVASVITSIGLDHTMVLGTTHAAIAAEKAGIVKPCVPVLVGLRPDDPGFATIAEHAERKNSPLFHAGRDFQLTRTTLLTQDGAPPRLVFDGTAAGTRVSNFNIAAGAPHQAMNALLAIAAAELLLRSMGRSLDVDVTRDALAATALPARAEWFAGDPPILLDGAHTAESVAALALLAQTLAAGRPVHALVGLTVDREPNSVFGGLAACASVTATTVPGPRGIQADALATSLGCAGVSDPLEALTALRARARGGLILITGSLYLAGVLRSALTQEPRRPLS